MVGFFEWSCYACFPLDPYELGAYVEHKWRPFIEASVHRKLPKDWITF